MDYIQRISNLVDASGDCWEWTGTRSLGYGKVSVGGKPKWAHRAVYEWLVGAIPDGLQIDHLCKNRGCVNPDHLEPVTQATNKSRGAGISSSNKCRRGHFGHIKENTYGYRICAECGRENVRKRRAKSKC